MRRLRTNGRILDGISWAMVFLITTFLSFQANWSAGVFFSFLFSSYSIFVWASLQRTKGSFLLPFPLNACEKIALRFLLNAKEERGSWNSAYGFLPCHGTSAI